MKTNRLHVISHTHWDREWYTEFQGFRQRLVYNIDRLLELLEARPEFKCFHMDGHTAWIGDYLEIRPENREKLKKYITEGRILVGDWFVMPDEFLLSGESIVRNLMLGNQICKEFGGEPMVAGNVIDVFGHISQLPQIFKEFGMEGALLHRGTSGEDENSEMVWEGADGTKILIIKVYPFLGYGDFLAISEVEKDKMPEFVREYEKKKAAFGKTNIFFGLDGNDHTAARWELPEHIQELNEIFTDTEVVHSNFNDYFKELKQALCDTYGDNWEESLKHLRGELRTPAKVGLFNETITGTGSSRVDLKQQNDETEILLSRYAETLHVWSKLTGGNDQKAFLNLAWKYLFFNHPHDSIVGCSIDGVHRDMLFNSHQANMLAENSIRESIQQICAGINTAAFKSSEKVVTIFNLSNAEKQVNECAFEIPSEEVYQMEEKGLMPVLVDANGKVLTQQQIYVEERTRTEYHTGIRYLPSPAYTRHPPEGMRVHRFHRMIEDSIPAMSFRTYGIQYRDAAKELAFTGPVVVEEETNTFENGLLRVSVQEDGRINLTDLETDTTYRGLIHYRDCGDKGNGWYYTAPDNDTVISSLHAENWKNVTVELVEKGPLQATYRVSGELMIPEKLDDTWSRRVSEASLKIVNELTLTAGEKRLDCKIVIENHAKQHELQVLFPVSADLKDEKTYFVDTAFDCLKRNIEAVDTRGWVEAWRAEAPMKSFVGIGGTECKKNGLAVITKGICEGCVKDDEERTIAVTLFRSFTQDLEATKTIDSLLLGEHTYEYAIVPVKADDVAAEKLFAEAERYKYHPFYHTAPVTDRENRTGNNGSSSLVHVSENLVISTIKATEMGDGIVVRVFNPSEETVTANICPEFSFAHLYECNMREEVKCEIDTEENSPIILTLRGKQVMTLMFTEESNA